MCTTQNYRSRIYTRRYANLKSHALHQISVHESKPQKSKSECLKTTSQNYKSSSSGNKSATQYIKVQSQYIKVQA